MYLLNGTMVRDKPMRVDVSRRVGRALTSRRGAAAVARRFRRSRLSRHGQLQAERL